MQEFDQTSVSKRFYPLIVCSLILFFILRFSPLLLGLFLELKPGSLPPTGIFTSPWLLGVMMVCFIGCSMAIRKNFLELRLLIESNPKRFLAVALMGLIVVFSIGKITFSVYTDEKRDIFVSNLLTMTSVQAYSQKSVEQNTPMTPEEKVNLDWARSLHPVGHYLPAVLIHKKEGTIFWRFFYGCFPLLFIAILIWIWKPVDKEQIWFIALVGIILISSAYFRNYVLIRVSNELIPAIGMTSFFLILWRAARGEGQSWWNFLLLSLAIFLSVSAKYSAVVTWGATIVGLIVVWAANKDEASIKALLFSAGSGLVGIFSHVYLWIHTDMLAGHRDNYGVKILKTLGLVPPDWMHTTGTGLEGSTSSITFLFLGWPVWFGPFIFVGLIVGVYAFIKKSLWRDPLWLFLVVFLVTNLAGVVAVNPRAAYLSPAVLPMSLLCALVFKKILSPQHCRELVFQAYAFVVINVLIISISSVKW